MELIFFPNMCHVCRAFGEKAVNLKICTDCEMVSYCSEKHQTEDRPNHKEFCRAIRETKKKLELNEEYQLLKKTVEKNSLLTLETQEEKVNYCKSTLGLYTILKNSLTKILGREINKAEQQILKFPKVCEVCFESNAQLLTNCKKCPQSSFCEIHLKDPRHEKNCSKFVHCLKAANVKPEIFLTISNEIKCLKAYNPETKNVPNSMKEFIESLLSNLKNTFNHFNEKTEEAYISTLSERFSRSLSILLAMEKLHLNPKSLIIHIVGSSPEEQFETDWELILHFLPELSSLKLILIGPNMINDRTEVQKICNPCKKGKRQMVIETKKAFYDQYCQGKAFQTPDMIVCFNPGFYIYPTWSKSIELFHKGKCPLLITSLSACEGLMDLQEIRSKFPGANCIYRDDNIFTTSNYIRLSSFLPISAYNQYISLFESL